MVKNGLSIRIGLVLNNYQDFLDCGKSASAYVSPMTARAIAHEVREAALRRFHRGEASRHTSGNGLGFSLIGAVAGMHHMAVRFDDVERGCNTARSRDSSTFLDQRSVNPP